MVNPAIFYAKMKDLGIEFFTGVPDSLLKPFCAYVTDNTPSENHVISSNEGASVGLAIGYYLSTGKVPLVYMQNSGLGNTINPISSLADKEVYSIPLLLMIGWRGEPNVKDEPQHVKQGRITPETLDKLEIPYRVIDEDEVNASRCLEAMVELSIKESKPCAILIKKGTFSKYDLVEATPESSLTREGAIKKLVDSLGDSDLVVSTTGMASRELFELRAKAGQGHANDFLTVGGMGHASQIALGVAKGAPDRRVICIDGDGAVLMHLGSLAISGQSKCYNFKHIVINNGAHDSVGGQPTVALTVDLTAIAEACGYTCFEKCYSLEDLEKLLPDFLRSQKQVFLEVIVNKGNRTDIGRPTTTPKENKASFMANIRGE